MSFTLLSGDSRQVPCTHTSISPPLQLTGPPGADEAATKPLIIFDRPPERRLATLGPISRLPDLCLIAIFKQLTPRDTLTAFCVCRRWADLVRFVNLHRYRFLAILVRSSRDIANEREPIRRGLPPPFGPQLLQPRYLTKWNSLQFNELYSEVTMAIVSAFTGTTELQVYFNETDHFKLAKVEELLHRLRPQLISLKLHITTSYISSTSLELLGRAINEIDNLKRLSIKLGCPRLPDLPVISQLEELVVESDDHHAFALNVARYAPAASAHPRIAFKSFLHEEDVSFVLARKVPIEVLSRFDRIELFRSRPFRDVTTLANFFTGLSSVSLSPTTTTVRALLRDIAKLKALVHLHLMIDFRAIGWVLEDPSPQQPLPQLTTLRSLKLEPKLRSHDDLKRLGVPRTMPNLEWVELVLDSDRCADCNDGWSYVSSADNCLRQALACFRQCGVIRHNYETLGTAAEILGP